MQTFQNTPEDYKRMMDHILQLPSCTLITTGRTGTDFLQSLLDSHSEIMTFNGHLGFYEFWRDSCCAKVTNVKLNDLLDEFIGKHIEKFKSRYDFEERKDRLGRDGDESIDIDLLQFKNAAKALLLDRKINSKNILLAIYGAYTLCLGQNLERKNVFFHHIHNAERLDDYLIDFPCSKIICMTRDPRANFFSGIEHWRKYNPNSDHGGHLFLYIKRILLDAYVLEKYSNDYVVMRIEDLGKKKVIDKLCTWLGISYEDQLTKSTWAGLTWRGDRLSANENDTGSWSAKMLNNSWEKNMSATDKHLLNFLMNSRLKFYGYQYYKNRVVDYIIIPFLILLPLSFELRYCSFSYIRKVIKNNEVKKIIFNCISYPRRVVLFYKYYFKTVGCFKFSRNFLDCSDIETHER